MQNISIEAGPYTPHIIFNHRKGSLTISGKSYMEYPSYFYKPVVSWINKFFKNNTQTLYLNFHLEYFNTGTSKVFFDLFDILEAVTCSVTINWHAHPNNFYSLAEGECFQEDFPELKFNVIT